ncbi:MAG: DUF2809 domain-containing protein [Bacteroidota bacterium]|nr:DUF2809 domain-containing protein [Bacteroidota bacterium]
MSKLKISNRIYYFVIIVLASLLGILSRKYSAQLPFFIAEYTGDTMWALAVFFVFRLVFNNKKSISIAFYSLIFSVVIEVSQIYKANWVDTIRQTTIGGLILGFGFLWSDIFCYLCGILIALFIECFIIPHFESLKKMKRSK